MNELKSNARLTGWVTIISLVLTAVFTYLVIKYYLAQELISFFTASLFLVIVFHNFLRFVFIWLKIVMEIRRHEMIQAVAEANERWGRR